MAGKGDTPRPIAVDYKTFSDNWDLALNKTKKKSKKKSKKKEKN